VKMLAPDSNKAIASFTLPFLIAMCKGV